MNTAKRQAANSAAKQAQAGFVRHIDLTNRLTLDGSWLDYNNTRLILDALKAYGILTDGRETQRINLILQLQRIKQRDAVVD